MSPSIVVVDDEPDVAEVFRQRFRREARQGVHFAASGVEALDRLAGGIDPELLVILSTQHAGPGRADTAGRGQKTVPDLPVMMVTGYGDDERRRRANTNWGPPSSSSRSISLG
jgi:CheY-like chemotaxis protein